MNSTNLSNPVQFSAQVNVKENPNLPATSVKGLKEVNLLAKQLEEEYADNDKLVIDLITSQMPDGKNAIETNISYDGKKNYHPLFRNFLFKDLVAEPIWQYKSRVMAHINLTVPAQFQKKISKLKQLSWLIG